MGKVSHFATFNYARTPNVVVHFDYLPMEQNKQIGTKITKF